MKNVLELLSSSAPIVGAQKARNMCVCLVTVLACLWKTLSSICRLGLKHILLWTCAWHSARK